MPFSPLRLSALALGFVLLASPVLAQTAPSTPAAPATPGQIAAARELINLTGALTTVDEMLPAFGEQIKRQAITRPEMTKDLDEVLKSLQPDLEKLKAQIVDKAAADYAKYMTEQELREVITFFKTPTGAKYSKAQPALIDDIVNDVSTWSEQVSEYIITRTRAEMAKRGHQMQ